MDGAEQIMQRILTTPGIEVLLRPEEAEEAEAPGDQAES
jgi:hypothetical protein